jgi:hypothetical protein
MSDLIIRDDSALTISFTTEAETMRAEALESSALISKVESADDNKRAVAAQQKLLTLCRAVEKARKAVKEPVLNLGRTIDMRADSFIAEVKDEGMRLAKVINDFQEKERVRMVAEQQLQNAAISTLEREMNEKITCADTIEEQERIREEYAERQRMASSASTAPARAHAQIVKTEWEITVTDLHQLYRNHSHCVELKPRLSEIKALLDSGVTVHGVRAERKAKATVRSEKPQKALEA